MAKASGIHMDLPPASPGSAIGNHFRCYVNIHDIVDFCFLSKICLQGFQIAPDKPHGSSMLWEETAEVTRETGGEPSVAHSEGGGCGGQLRRAERV